MKSTVGVEKSLINVLKETDLLGFQTKFAFEKQLTRIEHFNDVTDDELMSYGLSTPAVRRLRSAIEKRLKKGKLFGNKRPKIVTISAVNSKLNQSSEVIEPSPLGASPSLIPKDEIKLLEVIGEGTFALVKRGIWRRNSQKVNCAVKILHEMTEQVKLDLFSEISIMQKFYHQNVIALYGVVLGNPTLMVIEYCENGALIDRLRNTKKSKLLLTRLLNFSQQIVNGMSYLELRRFVHRDLAARNVLLTDNEEVVKICDFGLTRSLNENERLYVMSGQKKVPFAWCPPESLRFRQFSHESDVWAFGVTLWELFTFGEEPWIGYNAIDVLKATEQGECLKIPRCCPNEIYNIMKMCWNLNAENRPKFSLLQTLLQDFKFTLATCRIPFLNSNANNLNLQVDERVIVIKEKDDNTWFGQSLMSRAFGFFPRNAVTIRTNRELISSNSSNSKNFYNFNSSNLIKAKPSVLIDSQNFVAKTLKPETSFPIEGSFINNTNVSRSCSVDKIEETYLKNSTLGDPFNSVMLPNLKTTSSRPNLFLTQEQNRRKNNSLVNDNRLSFPSENSILNNSIYSNNFGNSFNDFKKLFSTSMKENSLLNSEKFISNKDLKETKLNSSKFSDSNRDKILSTKSNSKYDSAISIPRPSANRSPILNNFNTKNNLCFNSLIPSTSTLPSSEDIGFNVLSNKSLSSTLPAPILSSSRPPIGTRSSLIMNQSPSNALLNVSQQIEFLDLETRKCENDPFVVTDEIKTLATKSRYNDVLEQQCAEKNLSLALSEQRKATKTSSNSIQSSFDPFVVNLRSMSISNINLNDNTNLNDPLKRNSTVSSNKKNISLFQNESGLNILHCDKSKNVINSNSEFFLPPPSELLLSGFNNNLNISKHNNLALTNLNNSLLNLSTLYNGLTNNTFINEEKPRIRYGSNGIPILEPIPAPIHFQSSNIKKKKKIVSKPPVINLEDLNTDNLIAKVKSLVDFANIDQCRSSLRKHGFDVELAVKELKIEKLLEIGVVENKHLAMSALDSCHWNVNEAINRLVS